MLPLFANLTCCKFVALKENILFLTFFKSTTVFRPSELLRMFFMGDQYRALIHAQNFQPHPSVGCHSPPKIESSPFPSCVTPSFCWFQTTYWKKVSLIVFRQIWLKILPVVHIFSFLITIYLKKCIVIKSLSTKQCPAELSSWMVPLYPPSYQKCITSFHLACCPYHVWTALLLPPNLPFERNPVDGGRIPPSKNNAHFLYQKNSPHQIAIFM